MNEVQEEEKTRQQQQKRVEFVEMTEEGEAERMRRYVVQSALNAQLTKVYFCVFLNI